MSTNTPTLRNVLLADAQEYSEHAPTQLQCGIYLALNNDTEEARKYLERALKLDPELAEAREALSINSNNWPAALVLHSLNLSSDGLASLPPEIGQLTSLTFLALRNNQLTSLPPEIGQLTNLISLDLRDNQLTSLPPEIGQLTNLISLDLRDNQLTSLPPQIGQLTNLTSLTLIENQLTSLPPQIGQLTNLTSLYLINNQLTSLPPEIIQLTSLTSLALSNNHLTRLPPEIGQLIRLTSFDLSHNHLTSLPPQIIHLTNLTSLYLSHNHLTSLPPQIIHLTSLTSLALSHNHLTSLPPQIDQLIHLTFLALSHNQLMSLPVEIANLIQLQTLNLTDNPLPIPPEILELKENPAAIVNYYLQYLAQPRKPLNEAKVLLVGQGGVGKSSLIRRLIADRFDPEERKTEGIDIQHWQLPIGDGTICLNLWDFGGQEIMHATHQFFLTKRSLYILVIDNRTEEEDSRLEYWLKIIQSFGGDSPVIIVGNKADQHPMALDRRALQGKYENIRAFVSTSCQTGEGLGELETAIRQEIERLPHVQDELVASWFEVKATLEEMKEDYLPHERYLELCQSEEVRDEISQRTLLGFLHDLGIVLSFQDDLRLQETNILNPEWVTRAVYSILNSKLLAKSQGILERSMLNQILDAQHYPRNKQMFIIDMMRKFELCYDFEGAKDERFLVPDLLPKEGPDTGTWEGALAFQYHYSILPSSIISRFIVRMNHLIYQHTLWRSGVVLEDAGNKALVRADREQGVMYIKVSGPLARRRVLLKVVRTELDAIHETIPGLETIARVPLPEQPMVTVSHDHLLLLEREGFDTYFPEGATKPVSVRELLDGVDIDPERGHPSSRPAVRKARQGLTAELNQRLYHALQRTGYFDDERQYKFLFVEKRLQPWRDGVPSGSTAEQRARGVVAFLHDQDDDSGRGALGLLLEVLSEQTAEGNALKRELAALAQELRALGY